MDTTHVDGADLVADLIESQEQDDYFAALEPPVDDEFASWGFGAEPYEPSPYDGTYSEM